MHTRRTFVISLLAFGMQALELGSGLSLIPHEVPPTLIGNDVPRFDLPPVKGYNAGPRHPRPDGRSLAGQGLRLMVRRKLVLIHGLNHKDKPEVAAAWLDRWGDP